MILGEAIWSCSVCGAGGDAAALVMRMKGMVFRDAIAWLATQDGFTVSEPIAGGPSTAPACDGRAQPLP